MRAAEEILKDYAHRLAGFVDSIPDGRVFQNPNCGDSLCLALSDTGMRWTGEGCSLMMASASLLSLVYARALSETGGNRDAIKAFIDSAIGLALGEKPADNAVNADNADNVVNVVNVADDAALLSGMGRDTAEAREALFLLSEFARYPVRRECVLLPWNAMKQLLEEI